MAKADRLGPGWLRLGETGSPVEFGGQCNQLSVNPSYEDGEAIDFLDGSQTLDEGAETYTLSGQMGQDYTHSTTNLQVWCKANSGQTVPFVFRPDEDATLEVHGEVKVRAVKTGGDVKKRNMVEFEFPGVGDWDYVAGAVELP